MRHSFTREGLCRGNQGVGCRGGCGGGGGGGQSHEDGTVHNGPAVN